MKNTTSSGIQRGQAITFRIPSDIPDHNLRQLQKLKETEKRNFSSKIAEFVMGGVSKTSHPDREMITIPLPQKLSKAQRDWLKHAHSEAMLGSIIFHLLSDPLRATALLASLNSSSLDIDEALFLQERSSSPSVQIENQIEISSEKQDELDLELDNFDWSDGGEVENDPRDQEEKEEKEESLDDLLGDFLAQMNK
jgi:hypothetical protein